MCVCAVRACTERSTIDDDFIGFMSKARSCRSKPPSYPEFFGRYVGGAAVFWFYFVFGLYAAAASNVFYDKSNPISAAMPNAFMVITHTLPYFVRVYEDYELTKSNRTLRHTNTLSDGLAQAGGTHTHTRPHRTYIAFPSSLLFGAVLWCFPCVSEPR